MQPNRMVRFAMGLDAWVLGAVRVCAHTLQRWFGITSFRLMVHVTIALCLGDLSRALDYWVPTWLPVGVQTLLDVVLAGFAAIFMVGWIAMFHAADDEFRARPHILPKAVAGLHASTVLGIGLIGMRFSAVLLFPLVLASNVASGRVGRELAIETACAGLFPALLYLMHVFPLPPAPSTLREWIGAKLSVPPALVPIRIKER